MYEWNVLYLIRVSMKFADKGPIDNKLALVQVIGNKL